MFGAADIAALTLQQIWGLTSTQLASFNPANQVQGLSAIDLAMLDPATQLNGFTSTEFGALSVTQIRGLTSTEFSALDPATNWPGSPRPGSVP